jgi:L-lactate dehydrogenase complex protein LldG
MTTGKIQNRESFLTNLSEKLGVPRRPVSEHPFVPINQLPQEQLADKSKEELLEIVKARVPKIHTQLFETTAKDLADTLLSITKASGGGKLLLPTDDRFAACGLTEFIETELASEVTAITYWKPGNEYRDENIQAAEQANVSIAFAEFLLAESGTIVVETSAGQGRSLHFLPKHYISIIPMSKLVPRSTQAAAFYSEKIERGEKVGSAIHFISGPSNSGDIEMQLVVGLHGPVKVYYVVVTDL